MRNGVRRKAIGAWDVKQKAEGRSAGGNGVTNGEW